MNIEQVVEALAEHGVKLVRTTRWQSDEVTLTGAEVRRDARSVASILDSGEPVSVVVARSGKVWLARVEPEPVVVLAETRGGSLPYAVSAALSVLGLNEGNNDTANIESGGSDDDSGVSTDDGGADDE